MNLFVSNLSPTVTGYELMQIFHLYGEVVSSHVVMDRETRSSRGFGFVEMERDADAERAIKELNGFEVKGSAMVIKEARPKPQRQHPRDIQRAPKKVGQREPESAGE